MAGMSVDLATIGNALAAPARAAMVGRLLDGSTRTAGELAATAGVAASTASEHLATLVASGLVVVERCGRTREFRLVDSRVAGAIEVLSPPPVAPEVTSYRFSKEQRRLRAARMCYDHLAGQLGVAVYDAFVANRWLEASGGVPPRGRGAFADLTIDVDALAARRRPLTLTCTDWTERRSHLAGGLGAAVAALAFGRGWLERVADSRGLRVTPRGREGFAGWGVTVPAEDDRPY